MKIVHNIQNQYEMFYYLVSGTITLYQKYSHHITQCIIRYSGDLQISMIDVGNHASGTDPTTEESGQK